MTPRIAEIWRHPIKSHGRERVDQVTLEQGRAMPGDRVWAVAHERSCFDVERPSWNPCGDFSRGAVSPRLQAIGAWTHPGTGKITLSHPDRVDITIDPEDEGDGCLFVQWVMPVSNGSRLLPARLVRAPDEAMTDTAYQSVSIINLATHRAVEAQIGHAISPLRWRGNLLIDGLEPWAELDWIGKTIRLGAAEMDIVEPIKRCRATEANPETGERDENTLAALRDGFGHQNCGVYAKVAAGGLVQQGDTLQVPG